MTDDPAQCVEEALAKCGWTTSGPRSWNTSLTNGTTLPVSAWLDQAWFRVEARIEERRDGSPWDLLVAGGALPAPVRLSLADSAPRAASVRLVAELDVGERDGWVSRVLAVSAALIAAASRLHDPRLDECGPGPGTGTRLPESVGAAVREAGWAFDAHGENGIDIALDDGDRVGTRARAQACGDWLSLFAPLARNVRSADAECADALAVFLLRTAHRLRAVRAVARPEREKSEIAVGWEVPLALRAGSEAIGRALGALTVACRHSLREVQALADPTLARLYLSQPGVDPQGCAPRTAARPSR